MPGRMMIAATLATALVWAPTFAQAQVTTPPQSQAQDQQPEVGKLDTKTYVQAAAIGDLFEIESSKLVAERSQEPAIRSFAMTLIADHTQLHNKLRRILAEDGQTAVLPDRLDAPHMEMLVRLENTAGSDFDRLFVQAQLAALKEAMRIHEAYKNTGTDKDLVAYAGEALVVIRRHHDTLRKGVSPLDTAIRYIQ